MGNGRQEETGASGAGTPPAGADIIAEYVLHLDGGQLVAEVVRLASGAPRLRLGHGGAAGAILTVENIGALRVILARCLEVMCVRGDRAA